MTDANVAQRVAALVKGIKELEQMAQDLQLVINSNLVIDSNKNKEKEVELLSLRNSIAKHSNAINSNSNRNSVSLPFANAQERETGRTPKKRGATPDPNVRIFLSWYKSRYEEIRGVPLATSFGRDGRLIKDALRDFPLDRLKDMAETFLGLDDEFLRRTGWGINIFFSKLNALATQKPEGTGWEFLDAQ